MSTASFYSQLEAQDAELPPVEKWDPPLSGEMDCVIKRDGSWHIDGGELQNLRLKRLLSKVLKVESNDYFLVSPVEKWRIQVEDHPFMIVELELANAGTSAQILKVRDNVGEWHTVNENHPLCTSLIPGMDDDIHVPYAHIRKGLTARFNRNTHLQLAEYLESGSANNEYHLLSSGQNFVLHF